MISELEEDRSYEVILRKKIGNFQFLEPEQQKKDCHTFLFFIIQNNFNRKVEKKK